MSVATTVREKPVLFRGEMVNAILDGRKTQTRRLAKRTESGLVKLKRPYAANVRDGVGLVWTPHAGSFERPMPKGKISELCPHGSIGSHLWVRETWAPIGNTRPSGMWTNPKWIGRDYFYAADNDRPTWGGKWRPSIHMPRAACRLVLEITDVRVERLNDITPEDAVAEGVEEFARKHRLSGYWTTAFSRLWESINGVGSWAANPWVWVVSFRRVEQCR